MFTTCNTTMVLPSTKRMTAKDVSYPNYIYFFILPFMRNLQRTFFIHCYLNVKFFFSLLDWMSWTIISYSCNLLVNASIVDSNGFDDRNILLLNFIHLYFILSIKQITIFGSFVIFFYLSLYGSCHIYTHVFWSSKYFIFFC